MAKAELKPNVLTFFYDLTKLLGKVLPQTDMNVTRKPKKTIICTPHGTKIPLTNLTGYIIIIMFKVGMGIYPLRHTRPSDGICFIFE